MTRIRTTHVGSLPRPAEMTVRQLKRIAVTDEDMQRWVDDIIDQQLAAGLDVVNNGELPRPDYVRATVQRIAGFGGHAPAPFPLDLEKVPEYARRFSGRNGLITLNPKAPVELPVCISDLAYVGEASLRAELDMAARAYAAARPRHAGSAAAELFFTAPSPGTVALFMANAHYAGARAYLEKLGEVLHREYALIVASGALLQVDCPDLAMGRHTTHKALSDDEFVALADMNVSVLNEALSGLDPARCRAHICWGNYAGPHHCDIGLERIWGPLTRLKPRFLSLEACNHRHAHEAALFESRPFPADKVLMPGAIDTRSNIVDHPDLVAQRLRRFTAALGAERVMGCTDCGFATTSSATAVSGEVAWLKLAALVEGARRV